MKKSLYWTCAILSLQALSLFASEQKEGFDETLGKRHTRSSLIENAIQTSSLTQTTKNKKPRRAAPVVKETYGPFGEEFAIATTDTSFKHMLSLSVDNDSSIMQSFLNTFIPQFASDPVNRILDERPVSIPALKKKGQKQTFMDLHVATQSGMHYIIEMQAQRHEQFDERCLFYACSTYSKQLCNKDLKQKEWYRLLRPTIALQILDFDTNRAQGISGITGRDGKELVDTLYERSKANPLPVGKYIKNYTMTCVHSKQTIDDLRMIQVELPRSPAVFPPHKDFTETDWWLSLLRYSEKYTHQKLEELKQQGLTIPNSIQNAFHRLAYSEWDPQMQTEYKEDVQDRENFKTTLLTEFAEGEKKGIEIGEQIGKEKGIIEGEQKAKREMALNLIQLHVPDETILQASGLTQDELDALKSDSIS